MKMRRRTNFETEFERLKSKVNSDFGEGISDTNRRIQHILRTCFECDAFHIPNIEREQKERQQKDKKRKPETISIERGLKYWKRCNHKYRFSSVTEKFAIFCEEYLLCFEVDAATDCVSVRVTRSPRRTTSTIMKYLTIVTVISVCMLIPTYKIFPLSCEFSISFSFDFI
jgi:hypothetical protein